MVQALLDSRPVTALPAPESPLAASQALPIREEAGGRTTPISIKVLNGSPRHEAPRQVSRPHTPNLIETLVLSQSTAFPIRF